MKDDLSANLAVIDGPPVVGAAGFVFPTRMVAVRLPEGLFLWSPVRLTADLRGRIDAMGPVRHLIAPNGLHHLALADWQSAFPQAQLHAAPGVAAKRQDLRIDHVLGDRSPAGWQGAIDQLMLETRITTEVLFHHRESRTLLVTDLIQQMPPGWFRGWRALVARLDGMTAPEPSVPRKFRLAFRNRAALRAGLERIAGWAPERLVMAHGPVVETGAAGVVARAFAWA